MKRMGRDWRHGTHGFSRNGNFKRRGLSCWFSANLAVGIAFVGILLSIALFPLVAPRFWKHHFGKIAAF